MFSGFKKITNLLNKVEQRIEKSKASFNLAQKASLDALKKSTDKINASITTSFANVKENLTSTKGFKDMIGDGDLNLHASGSGLSYDQLSSQQLAELGTGGGLQLLHEYDECLSALTINNKYLAQKAEEIEPKIRAGINYAKSEQTVWRDFETHVQCLPQMFQDLHNVAKKIDILCLKVAEIEELLGTQAEVTVKKQLENWQRAHQIEIEQYQIQKHDEINEYRAQLEQQRKVAKTAKRKRVEQKQKQFLLEQRREQDRIRESLDKDFKKKLDDYILYGDGHRTGNAQNPMPLPSSPGQSLEQITIDTEKKRFGGFL